MGGRQSALDGGNSDSGASCSTSNSTTKIPNGSSQRSLVNSDNDRVPTIVLSGDNDRLSTFIDESDHHPIGSKRRKHSPNGSVDFYQAYNNTTSIISAPAASPQFTSSHLNANSRKFMVQRPETSEIDSTINNFNNPKRFRLDNNTKNDKLLSSSSHKLNTTGQNNKTDVSLLDRLGPQHKSSTSFGIFKTKPSNAQISLYSLHQKQMTLAPPTTPGGSRPSSSLSVISSDTRRLLRELERRNSPSVASRTMKLEPPSSLSSSQRSQQSEISPPLLNGLDAAKPPVASLITPYRANILPRLATLNKAPYSRPLKETADKGVSADLIGSCLIEPEAVPMRDAHLPKLTSTKSALKLKTVGGGRNKFSARGLDIDEPEVLYDNNELVNLPRLPLPGCPKAGFLTTAGLTPRSPPADTFSFSAPIVIARPSDINSPSKPNGGLTNLKTADQSQKSKEAESKTKLKLFSEKVPVLAPFKVDNKKDKWTCNTCLIPNPTDRLTCLACEAVKPCATEHSTNVSQDKWTCNTCFIKNPTNQSTCMACMAVKPSTTGQSAKPGQPTMFNQGPISSASSTFWYCPQCYIKVSGDKTNCCACGSTKLGETTKENDVKFENRAQNDSTTKPWCCTTCFFKNTADKLKCSACRASKPGMEFAPISFGFKPTIPIPPPAEKSSTAVQCSPEIETLTSTVAAPFMPKFGLEKTHSVTENKVPLSFGTSQSVEKRPTADPTSQNVEKCPTADQAPKFGFPKLNSSNENPSPFSLSFGISSTAAPFLPPASVEKPSTTTTTAPISFVPKENPTPFSFGIPSTTASQQAPTTTEKSKISGSTSTIFATKFDAEKTNAFPTTAENKAPFSFGTASSSSATATAGPSLFSAAPTTTTTAGSTATPFSFNFLSSATDKPVFPTKPLEFPKIETVTTKPTSLPAFSFGQIPAPTATVAPTPFSFGGAAAAAATTASSSFTFGGASTTKAQTTTAASTAPFSFATPSSGSSIFSIPSTSSGTVGGFNFTLPTASTAAPTGGPFSIPTTAKPASTESFSFGAPTNAFASSASNFGNTGAGAAPAFGIQHSIQPVVSTNIFTLSATSGAGGPKRKTLTAKRKTTKLI